MKVTKDNNHIFKYGFYEFFILVEAQNRDRNVKLDDNYNSDFFELVEYQSNIKNILVTVI